jgi:hypothetical protein
MNDLFQRSFIKNRLRSMLGDENLEALLLMNIHEAVLHSIHPVKVIDMLGKKSALMHKLLTILGYQLFICI